MNINATILFLFMNFLNINLKSQNIYKTPSGLKYHLENCKMVNNVSTKIILADTKKLNLTACKICKPPINAVSYTTHLTKAKGVGPTYYCSGITKRGTACKHKTKITNGYCYQHLQK